MPVHLSVHPFPVRRPLPRITTAEIISIVGLLWIALFLVSEPHTFHLARHTPLIASMAGIMPQPAWGAFLAGVGVAQFCTLMAPHDEQCARGWRWARFTACVLALCWWAFAAGGLGYADWHNPFVGLMAAIVVTLTPRLRWGGA